MIYNVVIEGQIIPVEEEIGKSDDAVKRALTPFYPEAANAMITRVTKDETVTITVVKRAGPKGGRGAASPLDALAACEGGKNPAVLMYEEIEELESAGELDPIQVVELDARIEQAMEEGQAQAQSITDAVDRLQRAASRPAPVVIPGF
jgi:hypothetical protein